MSNGKEYLQKLRLALDEMDEVMAMMGRVCNGTNGGDLSNAALSLLNLAVEGISGATGIGADEIWALIDSDFGETGFFYGSAEGVTKITDIDSFLAAVKPTECKDCANEPKFWDVVPPCIKQSKGKMSPEDAIDEWLEAIKEAVREEEEEDSRALVVGAIRVAYNTAIGEVLDCAAEGGLRRSDRVELVERLKFKKAKALAEAGA